MKYGLPGLLCVMLGGMALAAGPRGERELMQASMLVTGSITVGPDGSVKSHVVDHPRQLPPEVVNLIERNAPLWRFMPVVRNGRPVIAEAAMSLRVLARPVGDREYALSINGTHFGRPSSHDETGGTSISYKHRQHPGYPVPAAKARVSGTVYLLLAINRQGLVDRAGAEQVNLDVLGGDREMSRWRGMLAKAALDAAREWTFNVPAPADDAAPANRLVRVSVVFTLTPESAEQYGSWHLYVPGPRATPAWAGNLDSVGNADAVRADSVFVVGEGLQLAWPFSGA